MSTIKRGEGNVVPIVAGGTYTSGVPELIGGVLFGVPTADAVSGDKVGLEITGVHALPKTGGGGITFALGDKVYWNQSSHKATATATDKLVGVCVEAAVNADTEVKTRLIGMSVDAADADAVAAALGSGTGLALKTSSTAMTALKVNFAGTAAPAVTDDSDAGYAAGSFWVDTTNKKVYQAISVAVGAAVWKELTSPKRNVAATAAPAVTDDSAAGYAVGSLWFDITNNHVYGCTNPGAGAAVWKLLSSKDTSGTKIMSSGNSSATEAVGAAYDGKPVQVTVKDTAGAFHATDPIVFKAVVAAGTLTITAVNAISGAATNVASNVSLYYRIEG